MGTRGQGRALEGFAARLSGVDGLLYRVRYTARLAGLGDTAVYEDGQYCGTRGQNRGAEGVTIWIEKI